MRNKRQVDAASPLVLQHVCSVQSLVNELELSETSQVLVLNKADRIAEAVAEGQPDYALEAEPLLKADARVTPMCSICTSARWVGVGVRVRVRVRVRVSPNPNLAAR